MLSRVANSIYWISRYVERAENVARIVDVNLQLILDGPPGQEQQWQPLVDATGDGEDFAKRYGLPTQDNVLKFLAFDLKNPNSILSCLRAARENARGVREVISSAMWLQLNKFYLMVVRAADVPTDLDCANEFFQNVKTASHHFAGISDATMTHGASWHYLQMGRMLERADKVSRILDMKYYILLPSPRDVGTSIDQIQWGTVLRAASAFEMYCKRHGGISPRGAIEFLILNREFPRSVQFCLRAARDSLHAITGTPVGAFRCPSEKLLGLMCSELECGTVDDIMRTGLHEYIDRFQTKLNQTSETIGERFFAVKMLGASPEAFAEKEVGGPGSTRVARVGLGVPPEPPNRSRRDACAPRTIGNQTTKNIQAEASCGE
jgi:uncharacterized alpha-E superfamily protein